MPERWSSGYGRQIHKTSRVQFRVRARAASIPDGSLSAEASFSALHFRQTCSRFAKKKFDLWTDCPSEHRWHKSNRLTEEGSLLAYNQPRHDAFECLLF